MATNVLVHYRCRMCGGLFTRGSVSAVPVRADEALAEAHSNGEQTAVHTCHSGVAGVGDLAGVRCIRSTPNQEVCGD